LKIIPLEAYLKQHVSTKSKQMLPRVTPIPIRSSSGESVGGLGCSDGFLLDSLGFVAVEFHKLGKIELWLLEDLDLSDENVLKREDLLALLGDLLGDLVGKQLLEEVLKSVLGSLTNEDRHDLLTEEFGLGSLGVASCLDLALVAAGEGDGEHTYEVAVEGLGLHEGLNQGVPLLNEGAELVAGNIHAVEVGVAVKALDFLDLELDLSPCELVSVVVQLTERNGEDTTAEGIGGDLCEDVRRDVTYSDQQSCCRG